jgi:hypothetical protein
VDKGNLVLAVLATHAVIIVVQFAASYFTNFPKSGNFGIYVLLLPVGFNCFGIELPALPVAFFVMVGLAIILWSLRRPPGGLLNK